MSNINLPQSSLFVYKSSLESKLSEMMKAHKLLLLGFIDRQDEEDANNFELRSKLLDQNNSLCKENETLKRLVSLIKNYDPYN
ncbi:unnamed protein product [Blepharisma stoltei]|uniref:Uncharacterized protein n=1 Tax=Blepharisma stoltei TaxID=1481888 RepID=A0AAU9IA51_9CILI|nr:unnamed protein product [Blepharisma stoltei]